MHLPVVCQRDAAAFAAKYTTLQTTCDVQPSQRTAGPNALWLQEPAAPLGSKQRDFCLNHLLAMLHQVTMQQLTHKESQSKTTAPSTRRRPTGAGLWMRKHSQTPSTPQHAVLLPPPNTPLSSTSSSFLPGALSSPWSLV